MFWCLVFVSRSAFFDYFPDDSCIKRHVSMPGNYYLVDCIFQSYSVTNDHGGVVKFEVDIHFVSEYCSYYRCYVAKSYIGGAIYISTTSNGGVALNKICAYDVTGGDTLARRGQFANIATSSSKINIMENSAVSFCCNTSSTFHYNRFSSTSLNNGKIRYCHNNISKNTCQQHSGIAFSNQIELYVRFCTFSSNIANDYTTLTVEGGSNVRNITYCNFHNNSNIGSGNYGMIHVTSSVVFVVQSVFRNITNFIFTTTSSTINIVDCWISHQSTIASGTQINLINPLGSTITHYLTHLSTGLCETQQYEEVSGLGIPPTPPQSLPPPPTECVYPPSENSGITSILNVLQFIYYSTFMVLINK